MLMNEPIVYGLLAEINVFVNGVKLHKVQGSADSAIGDKYPPGPRFMKPCNFTLNYAVYWS